MGIEIFQPPIGAFKIGQHDEKYLGMDRVSSIDSVNVAAMAAVVGE